MTRHFNKRIEKTKRKALRVNATDAERCLWEHLRAKQLGTRFRRQYSIDAFVIDFYAPRCKLAIEIDGGSHFTPEGIAYDRERTDFLEHFGIEVMRFNNLEIFQNLDGVLASIEEAVRRRTSP